MSEVVTFTLDIEPLEQSPRTIWVYLPDSYSTGKKTYPVLYMFDGHNLFYDNVATYGKSWGIKDYLDKTKLDLVVIGQDCNHIGQGRLDEYCPLPPKRRYQGENITAKGDITAEWFVKVLKPECEKRFRIYKNRKYVGIGGSSMGGLMSDYMCAKYSDVYSKFACISPASAYAYKDSLKIIKNSDINPDSRVYRSYGTQEVNYKQTQMKMLEMLVNLSNAFTDKGCLVHNRLIVGGTHSEATWETIVPEFIEFLYPELF